MLENLVAWNVKESDQNIVFADWLQDKETRRDLIAIFRSIYHYKNHAEFLKLWWNINTRSIDNLNLYKDEEKRNAEIKDINERVLPELFGQVQELYESKA